VDQGQQLGAGVGRAGPLAEVDELVGGLPDAEPLGQGRGQQQARAGDRVGVIEVHAKLVQGRSAMGDWHRRDALSTSTRGSWQVSQPPLSQVKGPFHVHPGSSPTLVWSKAQGTMR
jgi:hypothetical protein